VLSGLVGEPEGVTSKTPKAFGSSQFEEAWKRYLRVASDKPAKVPTSATRDRRNVAAAQENNGDGGGFQGVGTTRTCGEQAESEPRVFVKERRRYLYDTRSIQRKLISQILEDAGTPN